MLVKSPITYDFEHLSLESFKTHLNRVTNNAMRSELKSLPDNKLKSLMKLCKAYDLDKMPSPCVDVPIDLAPIAGQRNMDVKRLTKYLRQEKGFNGRLYLVVTVVRFPDGTQKVLDGGGRQTMEQIATNSSTMKAIVYDMPDEQTACDYFAKWGAHAIQKLNAEQIFKAEYEAGDDDTVILGNRLSNAGIKINGIGDINGPECKLYHLKQSLISLPVETVEASKLLVEAFCKPPRVDYDTTISALVIAGLAMAIKHNPDLLAGRLPPMKEWLKTVALFSDGQHTLVFKGRRDDSAAKRVPSVALCMIESMKSSQSFKKHNGRNFATKALKDAIAV